MREKKRRRWKGREKIVKKIGVDEDKENKEEEEEEGEEGRGEERKKRKQKHKEMKSNRGSETRIG